MLDISKNLMDSPYNRLFKQSFVRFPNIRTSNCPLNFKKLGLKSLNYSSFKTDGLIPIFWCDTSLFLYEG